jgi:hypothetical protein
VTRDGLVLIGVMTRAELGSVEELTMSKLRTQQQTNVDDDARSNRLVMHVARLVQRRGAMVETQSQHRAILIVKRGVESIVPNIVIALLGVGLYLFDGGLIFLIGAGLALLGWHRKIVRGAEKIRLLVRVDERGDVTEMELGGAVST